MRLSNGSNWTNKLTFIYIENVVRVVLLRRFIVTAEDLIWPVVFFIFLLMVTGREIIFICSASDSQIRKVVTFEREHFSDLIPPPFIWTLYLMIFRLTVGLPPSLPPPPERESVGLACNVILVLWDNLKPKSFFVDKPWWPTQSA